MKDGCREIPCVTSDLSSDRVKLLLLQQRASGRQISVLKASWPESTRERYAWRLLTATQRRERVHSHRLGIMVITAPQVLQTVCVASARCSQRHSRANQSLQPCRKSITNTALCASLVSMDTQERSQPGTHSVSV